MSLYILFALSVLLFSNKLHDGITVLPSSSELAQRQCLMLQRNTPPTQPPDTSTSLLKMKRCWWCVQAIGLLGIRLECPEFGSTALVGRFSLICGSGLTSAYIYISATIKHIIFPLSCLALSGCRTDGRQTNDRTHVWPKEIWPKVKWPKDKWPKNTRSSGHLAERTLDRKLYLA